MEYSIPYISLKREQEMDKNSNQGFFDMEETAKFLKCGDKDVLYLVREKKAPSTRVTTSPWKKKSVNDLAVLPRKEASIPTCIWDSRFTPNCIRDSPGTESIWLCVNAVSMRAYQSAMCLGE